MRTPVAAIGRLGILPPWESYGPFMVTRRVPRDPGEIAESLCEQAAFLRSSAAAYDAGNRSEAKRMAVTLRLLLHHAGQSKALLVQAGCRDRWTWLDTAGRSDPRVVELSGFHRLTSLRLDISPTGEGGMVYDAMLDNFVPRRGAGDWVPFKHWWTVKVVGESSESGLSREDLVIAVANTDGGAHFDSTLDEKYHRVSRTNVHGYSFEDINGQHEMSDNIALPSIRQIAHETLRTMKRYKMRPPVTPPPPGMRPDTHGKHRR